MEKLKFIATGGLMFLFCLAVSTVGQTVSSKTGSVCLAPFVSPNNGEKTLANPSGGNRVQNYQVQIDKKAKVTVSNSDMIKISGLASNKKHLVKIIGDEKVVESFQFGFNDFSSKNLCLWFNSLYETWSLWNAKDKGKSCNCK